MKKFLLTFIALSALFSISMAQTPQYAHTTGSTTVDWSNVNGYPFSSGLNKAQWLYKSTQFATAPNGNVTKLYFRSASSGAKTLQDLTIKMAPTTITELPASLTFETQAFTTVFQATSHTITVQEGQWFEIALQTPFPYVAGQNFIVEISKTGTSGQLLAAYMPETYRGHVGATTANALVGNTNLNKVGQLGMDISTSTGITISGPDSLCLNSNGTFFGTPTGGTWSSSNTTVASINTSGVATALSAGTSTITYTVGTSSQTKVIQVNTPVSPSVTLAATPNDTICEGSSITLTATVNNAGTNPFYAWKINGNSLTIPNNAPNLSYTPGTLGSSTVRVIVTSSLACSGVDSVDIPIHVIPFTPPSLTITPNVAGTVCPGTSVVFTASPTNGGTNPSYQWKKNGTNVGTNSATYTDATLTNTDVITCQMVSNLVSPCISGTPVNSNQLSISFQAEVTPTLTLNINPTSACEGSPVTAMALPTNGGGSPSFEWFLNNTSVATSGASYTFTPNTADQIYCVMNSNANCVINPVVHSDTLSPSITPAPTVMITLNNGVLSSSVASGNQWYKDGNMIPGETNQTYTPTANGAYHVVVTENDCEGTSNIVNYEGTSIKNLQLGDLLSIYPNPVKDVLTIENTSNYQLQKVVITNVLGQQVLAVKVNTNTINTNALSTGLYNVKIIFKEGEVNRKLNVVK